jgi:ketosteroid isomerase-like protein
MGMTEALTHGAGRDLLAAWKLAWEARDVDAFMALFTEDADLRPDPFEEGVAGELAVRDHWNRFAASTVNTEFDAERSWVKDRTVLAAWHGASTLRRTAERVRHRGFMVLDLDGSGRIKRLRGYPQDRIVGIDSTVKPEPEPAAPQEEG